MDRHDTHLVVCKNPDALAYLIEESFLIGLRSRKGKPMTQGDALVARDILKEANFQWGKDFYIKRIDERR